MCWRPAWVSLVDGETFCESLPLVWVVRLKKRNPLRLGLSKHCQVYLQHLYPTLSFWSFVAGWGGGGL